MLMDKPMRKLAIGALAAAQLAAAPAGAASIDGGAQSRLGVFTGAQVRIPLGGARSAEPRVSLGIAPTVRTERFDGAGTTRIGEGLQLSLEGGRPVEFNLAGTRLDRLAPGEQGPEGPRSGVTTLGWVAIGVGAVAAVTIGAYVVLREGVVCGPNEC
jgi:hypothetical protein